MPLLEKINIISAIKNIFFDCFRLQSIYTLRNALTILLCGLRRLAVWILSYRHIILHQVAMSTSGASLCFRQPSGFVLIVYTGLAKILVSRYWGSVNWLPATCQAPYKATYSLAEAVLNKSRDRLPGMWQRVSLQALMFCTRL